MQGHDDPGPLMCNTIDKGVDYACLALGKLLDLPRASWHGVLHPPSQDDMIL